MDVVPQRCAPMIKKLGSIRTRCVGWPAITTLQRTARTA
jgi:hypothetical protein